MTGLDSKIRKADELYGLIDDGDVIAVGLSGGKDSTALLYALAKLREYDDKQFDIKGITVDPYFGGKPGDYTPIAELCNKLSVEYIVKPDNIYEVVFEIRKEKNPCSLCAKLRRGSLHKAANENGCNKVALGHHMDDVATTFWMNFINEGRMASFNPITYLDRTNITVIRPLVLCRESEIEQLVSKEALPVIKSGCPVNGITERGRVEELMSSMSGVCEDMVLQTFTAMQRSDISGFGIKNK